MHTYRQAVGTRLRLARKERHLTQIELCYIAGVDRTTYQRFESGLSDPHLGELALMARALGVTVADLVAEDRPPQ